MTDAKVSNKGYCVKNCWWTWV